MTSGRWPANVVLSHVPTETGEDACAEGCVPGCPVSELDEQSGTLKSGGPVTRTGIIGSHGIYSAGRENYVSVDRNPGDSGGASRFFPIFRYGPSGPAVTKDDSMTDLPRHVWCGDATAVMRTQIADASVDSIVCDPPYGLAEHKTENIVKAMTAWCSGDRDHVPDGRGFMGRKWDAFVPPPAVWDECMRVLKPGGHMLVFAGTRTMDLMGLSIRLAGFEMRDMITWHYGCLTADTEILTENGWRAGIDVTKGERVAQWSHATGAITLAPVLETYRAPWDGPMRVLRNADTDQVLTPNHRVYHQPRQREMVNGVRTSWFVEDEWEVAEAGDLSTWNWVKLPIAGLHDGPGIGGDDYAALLGWVWTEGGFDLSGTGVRLYQSSVNQDKVDEIAALMDRMGSHKRYDQQRTYTRRNGQAHPHTAVTWYFSGELANRVRADLPGKRPTYDLLWRMTANEKQAFLRAALLGDGSQQRNKNGTRGAWQFYQNHEDDLVWFQTLLTLVNKAGKVGMRTNRPGGAVYVRDTATTEMHPKVLRNAWENYVGEVWCVRVPTGAFVARRNGKVFITGNSGFPKSLDVGKAIDKASGVEREVVAVGSDGAKRKPRAMAPGGAAREAVQTVSAPATAAAKQWHGFGTALKPAAEPILVARKPFPGTVAANVLQHGTGALNIDATRVGHASADDLAESQSKNPGRTDVVTSKVYGAGRPQQSVNTSGRWPANVVLSHSPECNGECQPDCPVAELDAQSGVSSSVRSVRLKAGASAANGETLRNGSMKINVENVGGFNDAGGASRFFPTFRYQAKAPTSERPKINGIAHPTVKPLALMRWLCRLVTPPGGTVLDPFAGSGTTGEAAQLEGFGFYLIEQDEQYLPHIFERLTRSLTKINTSPDDDRRASAG